MTGRLVVEAEAFARVSDLGDTARVRDELEARCLRDRRPRRRAQRGLQWVVAERVLDVGEDQLLMLLLVMEPERHQKAKLGVARAPFDETDHVPIDVLAIGTNL